VTPGRYIAVGLALATALVGLWLMLSGRSVARLDGGILQVRQVATDTRALVVILDVRVTNPGRAMFMVKNVSVLIEDAEGTLLEADAAAEPDIDRLLDYHKLLGPRYNPTLKSRQQINPGQTADYTMAGAFLLTEDEFAQRRSLRVRILDVDGAQVDLGPVKR
jgi:hypothetical protein